MMANFLGSLGVVDALERSRGVRTDPGGRAPENVETDERSRETVLAPPSPPSSLFITRSDSKARRAARDYRPS